MQNFLRKLILEGEFDEAKLFLNNIENYNKESSKEINKFIIAWDLLYEINFCKSIIFELSNKFNILFILITITKKE